MATRTKTVKISKTEDATETADRFITHTHLHRHPGTEFPDAHLHGWAMKDRCDESAHGHWHRHDARERENHSHAHAELSLWPSADSAAEDATNSKWLMERPRPAKVKKAK